MRGLPIVCLLLTACSSAPSTPAGPAREPIETRESPLASAAVDAELDFEVGWIQVQRGAIVQGGHVEVTYAPARMSACAGPTVFSYARFDPGGELFSSDEELSFDVPAGATSVALWFHAIAPGCEQWDSSYGRNWVFPIVAASPSAIGWVGDWGSSTDRACTHGAGVPEPITIDEFMREEACIFVDADVWTPGATDVSPPHPEWILAQVVWAKDTQAPVQGWLDYEGIVGHNARFRWSVPYEIRDLADWSTVSYSFRFSTDGVNWTNADQASGASWTISRAFTLPTN
jgi:hypothetical protein